MTSDIKKSWFEMNKKPSKLKRFERKIGHLQANVGSIFYNAIRFGIELPDEVLIEIIVKYKFYRNQQMKLHWYRTYIETGKEMYLSSFNGRFMTKEKLREDAISNLAWTKKHKYL